MQELNNDILSEENEKLTDVREKQIIGEKEEVLDQGEIKDLEIESLNKKLLAQKDLFLRTAAEYDNYRKRTEKDKGLIYKESLCATVSEFLQVADSLEAAVNSLSKDVDEEYKKGLELVYEQLSASLKKLGVEDFGSKGDPFDPEYHSAIAHIEDENLDQNTIIEVFQKGYRLNDKIIRHAVVKVAN